MKEHYSTKLKRQLAETEARRIMAVEALKQIALGKAVDAEKTADAALRKMGLFPVSIDANVPPNTFVAVSGFAIHSKPDDYV